MALKAIAFRIIVKPQEVEKEVRTASGIVVASLDSEKDKKAATTRGTIVGIGEDAWAAYKPKTPFAGLKIGDEVFYAKYAGKMIKETDDGDEFIVLHDEDIVCKVEDTKETQ